MKKLSFWAVFAIIYLILYKEMQHLLHVALMMTILLYGVCDSSSPYIGSALLISRISLNALV